MSFVCVRFACIYHNSQVLSAHTLLFTRLCYWEKWKEFDFSMIHEPWWLLKKGRPRYGYSRGTMQHQHSCQNSWSIHDYVVPKAVCTHVLYVLTVCTNCDCTVVLLTDQSITSIQGTPHMTHTHTQDTDKVKCWAWVPRLKIWCKALFVIVEAVCKIISN